jgi:hypothetical protein
VSGALLVVPLAYALAAAGPEGSAQAQPPPQPAEPAPPPRQPAPPPAQPSPPPQQQPPVQTPFRLSVTFTHVLAEDGPLTNSQLSTNAIGIDMAFPSGSYVRNHLGLSNQWESAPGYSARGLRIDLISFGYPIELVKAAVRLDLEPILTLVRGEIMFPNVGPTQLRLEGGFGLELSATFRRWFLNVEPAVDFRVLVYTRAGTETGFGRVFPMRASLGHEF